MSVSKRVRFEVFKRDNFTCQYCGQRPPTVTLEVDHIVPRAEGGADDAANLTTACFNCNRGKGAVGLGDTAPAVDEMAVMAGIQEMLERKEMIKRSIAVAESTREAIAAACNVVREWWLEEIGAVWAVEDTSIRRFLADLTMDEIEEAIAATRAIVLRRDLTPDRAWQYFCGVCWNMIRQRRKD